MFMQMEKYQFIEKLGRGTHGTVYLLESVKNKTLKVVCKSIVEKYIDHAKKEVEILNGLNHRRVVRIIEFIYSKGSNFIILEYANRGTLDTVIKFFIQKNKKATNFLLWSVFTQILDGLEYLHNKKIIHRDIKPSNILINAISLDKNEEFLEFKICDFSLSYRTNEINSNIESSIIGTPFYMAPEIVSRKKYDNRVDIWGLGIVMYEMCTLTKPFVGEDRKSLYENIKTKILKSGFINDEVLESIILKCLIKHNRPSAEDLLKLPVVKMHLLDIELRLRDIKIRELEFKIKYLKKGSSWPPTPK